MACRSDDAPAAPGSRMGLGVVVLPTRSMPKLLGPMLAALLTLTCGRHAAAFARPVPIRTSEYLAVEGAELFLLTRGADRPAPVLLWLHGGPGGAERPLFRYFNSALEEHFIIGYFDQRGAGRSFDPDADPRRLTIARHLADLDAVVDHLRQGLGQAK